MNIQQAQLSKDWEIKRLEDTCISIYIQIIVDFFTHN